MRPLIWAAALSLAAAGAAAAPVDDSDLSRPRAAALSLEALSFEGRRESGAWLFPLTWAPSRAPVPGRVTGQVLLADRRGALRPARLAKVRVGAGAWTSVSGDGSFDLPSPKSGRWRVRVSLDNARWTIASVDGKSYEWESPELAATPAGVDAGVLTPVSGSENAKAAVLHLTYLDALDFLAREAELTWWTAPYRVTWPGDADYYSPQSRRITLSNALAWDVVLHELGHAVMDGAMDAAGAGGSHKIDECYSSALAWSEGWATYFAGAVALSADDPDARFEFLVPRRAPIRLENVPGDVCRGIANEWRVAAGLWDLTDRHADGEDSVLPFRALWQAARSGKTADVLDLWKLLAPGLDPGQRRLAQDALAANTLGPRAPSLARLPRLAETSAPRLFDGR